MTEQTQRTTFLVLLSIITFVAAAWLLQTTYFVTMPLVLSFFVAVLLHPVQVWVAARVPYRMRWLGPLTAMAIFVLVLAALGAFSWLAFDAFSSRAVEYTAKLREEAAAILKWTQERGLPFSEEYFGRNGQNEGVVNFLTAGIRSFWAAVAMLVVVFFLVLLMLLEARCWRDKSRNAFRRAQSTLVLEAMEAIAEKVRDYLWLRVLLSIIAAAVSGTWLWLMGVDLVFVLMGCTFLLNFLPNLGSVISTALSSTVALVQFGPKRALVVVIGLIVLEQLFGNFVDPRISGKRLQISPFVVLVSLLFWGWVWGAAGAFLAVPIMVSLIILMAHIPSMEPMALLLSNTSSYEKLAAKTSSGGDGDAAELDSRELVSRG